MRSIPILLAQTGTTTEDGVKQAERVIRPVAPGDRSTKRATQARLRKAYVRWPSPVADLQASGLAH